MSNIIDTVMSVLSLNTDAVVLSVSTALATGIVLGLKSVFTLARKLAGKSSNPLPGKIVDETEAALKDKSKDI